MKRQYGVTLIELMVTLAILAIVAAIAIPSFQSTVRTNRLASTGNEILGFYQQARGEAIRNNRRVVVAIDSAPDINLNEGHLTLFVDENRNQAEDTGETRLRTYILPDDNLSLAGKNPGDGSSMTTLTFLPNGQTLATSGMNLDLCDDQNEGRRVQILRSGYASLDDGGAVCP